MLPVLFAVATMRELERSEAMLVPGGSVKIARAEVQALVVAASGSTLTNPSLRWLVERVRKRPFRVRAAARAPERVRTAFVTGASGFVGANLVRALLAAGWRVRALVRGEAPSLAGLAVEVVRGDLFFPGLADAMRGCDAVFHVAATYSLWRRDRAALIRANVEGTRGVLAAARAAGVPRVVHTSSVAAIGVRADGAPADETHQSPPARLVGAYKRSKYFAEREARAAFEAGQDVVIVSPTTPVGPWDAKPTPTGEILVRFLNRRMPAYVDTGLNLIDVRDVAAGHLAAYERGVAGERYILGNENLTLRELLGRLAAIADSRRQSCACRTRFRWPTRRSASWCWRRWVFGPTCRWRACAWRGSGCTTTRRKRCGSWACRKAR